MIKLKPGPLRAGDLIGVVAPGSPVSDGRKLETAAAILTGAGYRVKLGTTTLPREGYLAGSDLERIIDLERLWLDESVAAIWCLRGGYGTMRLLSRLAYGRLAKRPKILIGFSDITALELALWRKIKLVSFHGPVLTTLDTDFSRDYALQMLSGQPTGAGFDWPDRSRVMPLYPGRTQGVLLGGNLTILGSLLGTPYFPDLENGLLFIEEVHEAAYRVDRLLTQLRESGVLNGVAGILIGQSIPVSSEAETDLIAVFRERLGDLKIPAVYGFPIGHLDIQWTLPQGIRAELDAEAGTLSLLESPFHAI